MIVLDTHAWVWWVSDPKRIPQSATTRMEGAIEAGETLRLDTGCLVAMTPQVTYDIAMVGGIKNSIFGGEGLFLATLTGPGTVWCQSLPFTRLAGRILANVGPRGKGEGSVLGGLQNIFKSRR